MNTKAQQFVADGQCECDTIEARDRPCANSRLEKATPGLWVATLETRSFSFEAFAAEKDEAWGALVQGLRRHGVTHGLCDGWFGEYLSAISVRPVEMGAAYRDREAI